MTSRNQSSASQKGKASKTTTAPVPGPPGYLGPSTIAASPTLERARLMVASKHNDYGASTLLLASEPLQGRALTCYPFSSTPSLPVWSRLSLPSSWRFWTTIGSGRFIFIPTPSSPSPSSPSTVRPSWACAHLSRSSAASSARADLAGPLVLGVLASASAEVWATTSLRPGFRRRQTTFPGAGCTWTRGPPTVSSRSPPALLGGAQIGVRRS